MTPSRATSTARQRFFAFIRAINVGGRRLTNDELIKPFVHLGLNEVAAYQAAGNVTFCSDDPEAVRSGRIETALADAYGFDAPVFVRNRTELLAIDTAKPFSDDAIAKTAGRIQVAFMRAAAGETAIAEVEGLVPKEDCVAFSDREWFWLPTRGISDSELPVSKIERLVGPMTIRTTGTISRMLSKFD